MSTRARVALASAMLAALLIATATALGTPSSGFTAERLGSVVITDRVDNNRAGIQVKTTKPVEVFSQRVTFAPGSTSGWHHHPGVSFVSVIQGTLTSYDDKCQPSTYAAGTGFVSQRRAVHVARNEGPSNLVVLVTYLKPAPTPALPNFVDEPAPAGCAIR